mmetsp:Transcript_35217/g.101399  ORF Transcript_35217/g.101399 Transcript_35217/m.101399 type:complete len:339 (-) Transcript_35217:305-1321(-)
MTALVPDDVLSDDTPKVLICGPSRSGKTSVLKVVFQKLSPHETLFLESTPKADLLSINRNALVRFKFIDAPGTTVWDEVANSTLFQRIGVIVIVLDAQEEKEPYQEAVAYAKKVIEAAMKVNNKITIDILIHKVDGDRFFHEDVKSEIQGAMHARLNEELRDTDMIPITFHCTSIYDHTVFEAVSKVVQKLLPQLNDLEQCLDALITSSRMDKAYLFDLFSKVYIASDPQPVDLQSYELCADMIDVVIDVSCIYSMNEDGGTSSFSSEGKASCIIHLKSGTLLYLREIDRSMVLVCILREENFDRQHLVDYNIQVFKDSLLEIFKVSQRSNSFVSGGP